MKLTLTSSVKIGFLALSTSIFLIACNSDSNPDPTPVPYKPAASDERLDHTNLSEESDTLCLIPITCITYYNTGYYVRFKNAITHSEHEFPLDGPSFKIPKGTYHIKVYNTESITVRIFVVGCSHHQKGIEGNFFNVKLDEGCHSIVVQ
jgi:hypothetical protein